MKLTTLSTTTKLAVLTLLLCLASAELSAQVSIGDYTQILLKSGYTIKGKVLAFDPEVSIILQMQDGDSITYQTADIEAYGKGAKPSFGGSNGNAQFNPDNMRLVANLGFGTTSTTNKDFDTKSVFKFPALIGFGISYKVDKLISLHADLNFERKGYKIDEKEIEFKTSLSYLTLPIYAGINFPLENLIFFAQAGPYIGVLLKEKEKVESYEFSYGYYYYFNSQKSFDIGFLLAAGLEIPFNEQISIRAGLRYAQSFRGTNKIKSFNALLSLAYRL